MLCARVMRGISSIEKAVTPACASIADRIGLAERIREADHDLPLTQPARSGGTDRTWSMMSAVENTASRAATVAPACS